MGFVQRLNEHISTEERRESFKLHARYAWSKTGEHIELEYADLPEIIAALQAMLNEYRPFVEAQRNARTEEDNDDDDNI